jgi:ABC-type sugar transport system, permease component
MAASLLKKLGYKPTVESVKSTAMVISAVPIMMVYPFLQKYFVKGMMIGSIKG